MSVVNWQAEVAQVLGPSSRQLSIYRADNQPPAGKFIGLYGRGGVGKTDMIGQLAECPAALPMLYFNIDGGAWTLPNSPDIVIVNIFSWQQFLSSAQGLFRAKALDFPFKTVVIENGTELQALSVLSILGYAGGGILGSAMPTQQQWGKSTSDVLVMCRGLHDFSRRTGAHVIMTAWEDLGKDAGETTYRRGIGLTPSLAKSMTGIFDIIGHITVKNDPPNYTHVINFAANPLSDAKFRRKRGEPSWQIPNTIAYRQQHNVLRDILNVFGGAEWPTKEYASLASQATVTQIPVTDASTTGVVETVVAAKLEENKDNE